MKQSLELFFLAPFFFALAGFWIPKGWEKKGALVASVALFITSFWLPSSTHYFLPFALQVDSLAKIFIWLTCLLQIATILVSPTSVSPALQYALLFLLQGFAFGLFMTEHLLAFFFFWEALLVPVYLGMAIFGGEEKKALYSFILYMAFGSVALLVAISAVYADLGSFSLSSWQEPLSIPLWVGGAFVLAFVVKTPLFPFHSWLPLTYSAAPLPFRLLLVALLSKVGIFGFFRWFPVIQESIQAFQGPLVVLSLLGAVYAGFVAWGAPRLDSLLAYASLSHLNLLLAGLFVGGDITSFGVLFQTVQHSLTLFTLFLLIDWLEKKRGSLEWVDLGGVVAQAPRMTWWTFAFLLSLMSVPGFGAFVGEWLILVGIFRYSLFASVVVMSVWLLSAIYAMQWMERVYFGPSLMKGVAMEDLSWQQMACIAPFFLLMLGLGIYPEVFFQQLPAFLFGGP